MKDIDQRATAVLLASLDREIDLKCIELKEKQKERRLRNIFLLSCLLIFFSFFFQAVFKVFNVNFLLIYWVYQGLAFSLLIPFILNFNRGGILR